MKKTVYQEAVHKGRKKPQIPNLPDLAGSVVDDSMMRGSYQLWHCMRLARSSGASWATCMPRGMCRATVLANWHATTQQK
jgi:hypothetical protein